MALASGSEWFGRITGKEPTFTRFKVTFTCASRWHNIERARRVLSYEPQVGLEEGIKRMVEVCGTLDYELVLADALQWWYSEYQAGNHKIGH